MQYYTDINSYRENSRTAVTLGKFDSLHRGHQKLIGSAERYARIEHLTSVVFAFDMGRESLLTNEERRAHLKNQVDCMIQCPFTKEIREMEAECFIKEVLADRLKVSHIVVGTDFRFGHGKRGDVRMLKKYSATYGYHLSIVEKEMYQGREISSTYVREALLSGDIELANCLLGYPYHMTGIVGHGQKLGRTLGFPTMNLAPPDKKIMPRAGVYACKIFIDEKWFYGIGNVGTKPTVTDVKKLLAEVYVFGYEGNAYGKRITVEFCAFERPEAKFGSINELKAQVDADIAYGMKYFQLELESAEVR